MTTRRIFLRNSALAMVGIGAAPLWLKRALPWKWYEALLAKAMKIDA